MIYDGNLPLWLTEDVTWPLLWGLLSLGAVGFVWFVTKQNRYLLGVLAIGGLLIGALVIEQRLVTDKEYLVSAITTMAEAVRQNDVDTIVQFVRDDNEVFKNRIRQSMKKYKFSHCNLVGFNRTDVDTADKEPREALIGFAVWATGSIVSRPDTFNSANVRVNLEFRKTGDRWTIEGYGYQPSNDTRKMTMVRQ